MDFTGVETARRRGRQIAFGHKDHRRPQTARFARVAFARRLDLAAPCERVFGRQQLTVNTVPRSGRTVAELTPNLIGPDRFGIQIETTPKKSVLVHSFGKISSMVTFNVTSKTPSSALDDSEFTLLLFNRGPGAVLAGVTEIFDQAKAMLLQPRRAARLAVTGGASLWSAPPPAAARYSTLWSRRGARRRAHARQFALSAPLSLVNLDADSLG